VTVQRYEILAEFTAVRCTPAGEISGTFEPGVTGDDLSSAHAELLASYVGTGLVRVHDDSAPSDPAPPAPAPNAPDAPDSNEEQQS
jgi:hypothetical protein